MMKNIHEILTGLVLPTQFRDTRRRMIEHTIVEKYNL